MLENASEHFLELREGMIYCPQLCFLTSANQDDINISNCEWNSRIIFFILQVLIIWFPAIICKFFLYSHGK